MSEYVITPGTQELPEATALMDELHRRGFPVEINVKGTAQSWESIRFYEPGPPEIECFLSREEEEGRLRLSLPADFPSRGAELQLNLADLLLSRLGGLAENTATRERFIPLEFAAKLKALQKRPHPMRDFIWIGFSWAVVIAGIVIWVLSPHGRPIVPLVVLLSFISAAGLTYSHFKA